MFRGVEIANYRAKAAQGIDFLHMLSKASNENILRQLQRE